MTVIPAYLKTGDEIRIVAPASVVEGDYIEKTVKAVNELGYNVSLGKNVHAVHNQFAGTDEERRRDFQQALDDPDVKAIFCARGGYGSVRILPQLDFSQFRKHPKWIVGFSDITFFHTLLNSHFNIASIHSPMPVNHDSPFFEDNLKRLDALLKGDKVEITIEPNVLNRTGQGNGKLSGGNLSILYSAQATPYEVDTSNSILFIEDVGEQLYHLDRMMFNLKLSGKLNHLNGLIAGGFTAMQDKKRPFGKNTEEIILDSVAEYSYPVVFNFPAGHMENNRPFILGAQVRLDVNDEGAKIIYN